MDFFMFIFAAVYGLLFVVHDILIVKRTTPDTFRYSRTTYSFLFGVAIAITLIGYVVLGMPGALILALTTPLYELVTRVTPEQYSEHLLSIGYLVTAFWPVSLPAGYLIVCWIFPASSSLSKIFILLNLVLIWAFMLNILSVWVAMTFWS